MSKIIINSLGKVLTSGGNALEVTSSIDSNIIPSNIKKDVNILGVTGTYEGSGGNNVISFSVKDNVSTNTYQAEKDMTWEEWINSSYYNSNYNLSITAEGYVVRGGLIVKNPTYYNYTGYPSEYGCNVIKSNRIYSLSGGSND